MNPKLMSKRPDEDRLGVTTKIRQCLSSFSYIRYGKWFGAEGLRLWPGAHERYPPS